MPRYSTVLSTFAAAIAAFAIGLALPAVAAAGCPGCEEYTLDIPEDDPAPAPAPAPAPTAAPTAPATPTTPTTPTTTVPTTTVPGTSVPAPVPTEDTKPKKPEDTDADPVPDQSVDRVDISKVPAVEAIRASDVTETTSGSAGGVLPLAIAMVMVALVGAVLGWRRRPAAAEPETASAERG